MKTKLLSVALLVIVIIFSGYNVYQMQMRSSLSELVLANVEALALDENNPFPNPGSGESEETWQIGEKTITKETYKTTEAGWTWNAEANAWFFKGNITGSTPSSYEKNTEIIKLKCCRSQGDLTVCSYETC